jgi:C1A family cysteine protease
LAGWTDEGYKQSPLGKGLKAEIFNGDGVDAPASTDWRESGAVTPVKDQG